MKLRDLMFVLPNLFTVSSIFCGFYAMTLCTGEAGPTQLYQAAIAIFFGMFFDGFDGRVARLTKTQSAFGVQFDSLADVVSFGLAPAVLVYQWSLQALGTAGALAAFGFLACGAIRLARFNVLAMGKSGAPKKPGKYIVGLPIPGAAGILVSLVVANHTVAGHLPGSPFIVLAVVIALGFLMVSTIRFRSFKDLKLNRRTLLLVAFVLATSAGLALRFHVSFALVWLLASYVALGVAETLFQLSRRSLRPVTVDNDEQAAVERNA
jgi:CDP-diacylglycerol--serine O-phosphatidyltransferase